MTAPVDISPQAVEISARGMDLEGYQDWPAMLRALRSALTIALSDRSGFAATVAQMTRELEEARAAATAGVALADAVQEVIHAQTNYTIDVVGLDKMKAQKAALDAFRKVTKGDSK